MSFWRDRLSGGRVGRDKVRTYCPRRNDGASRKNATEVPRVRDQVVSSQLSLVAERIVRWSSTERIVGRSRRGTEWIIAWLGHWFRDRHFVFNACSEWIVTGSWRRGTKWVVSCRRRCSTKRIVACWWSGAERIVGWLVHWRHWFRSEWIVARNRVRGSGRRNTKRLFVHVGIRAEGICTWGRLTAEGIVTGRHGASGSWPASRRTHARYRRNLHAWNQRTTKCTESGGNGIRLAVCVGSTSTRSWCGTEGISIGRSCHRTRRSRIGCRARRGRATEWIFGHFRHRSCPKRIVAWRRCRRGWNSAEWIVSRRRLRRSWCGTKRVVARSGWHRHRCGTERIVGRGTTKWVGIGRGRHWAGRWRHRTKWIGWGTRVSRSWIGWRTRRRCATEWIFGHFWLRWIWLNDRLRRHRSGRGTRRAEWIGFVFRWNRDRRLR